MTLLGEKGLRQLAELTTTRASGLPSGVQPFPASARLRPFFNESTI
jgi:hypothetical protein